MFQRCSGRFRFFGRRSISASSVSSFTISCLFTKLSKILCFISVEFAGPLRKPSLLKRKMTYWNANHLSLVRIANANCIKFVFCTTKVFGSKGKFYSLFFCHLAKVSNFYVFFSLQVQMPRLSWKGRLEKGRKQIHSEEASHNAIRQLYWNSS